MRTCWIWAERELVALGIVRAEEVKAGMVYRQPKAYPVYDGAYLAHLAVVREWLRRALPNLWLVGRNGMASLQQSGPLDDDGDAGGAEYRPGRQLRSLAGQYRPRIHEEKRAGERGRRRRRGRAAGAAADRKLTGSRPIYWFAPGSPE